MIDRLIDCGGGGGGSGDYGKMLDWFESQSERVAKLEAERDEWKHRAEVLERVIKDPSIIDLCDYCTLRNIAPPDEPCDSCDNDRSNWQFDFERFAQEAQGNEPKI